MGVLPWIIYMVQTQKSTRGEKRNILLRKEKKKKKDNKIQLTEHQELVTLAFFYCSMFHLQKYVQS